MPSGAKKRKTAKKKNALLNSGSDDVQHYDGKETDGGSPASQDHPFVEGDEKREGSSSGSGENVSTEDGIVQIQWELKSEEDYGSKEGNIQVHTGGSSGSSSSSNSSNSSRSSSDDESSGEKKKEVIETAHAVDSVKPVDSLSEMANQVDTIIPPGENNTVVPETASEVTPDKASLIEDVVQVNESVAADDYSVTPVGYKLELLESPDKILPSSDYSTGISHVLMDSGSRKDEDKAASTSEEKPAVVKDSATEGEDDKLLLSFNAPTVYASNDADRIKESESPESSGSQPLVASAPQAVQKTPFKSCCGIFELFTSSDR